MKVDAFLYLEGHLTDHELTFAGNYLPESLTKTLAAAESIDSVYYSLPLSYKGRLSDSPQSFTRTDRDDISFWKRVFSTTQSDHIVRIHADSPFLDAGIIGEMIALHLKYLAEFTYSENLPAGIASEILSRELIESIPESKDAMVPLGEVIRSNINRFDVELYYCEPDIRDKRISFRSGDPRDKKIMENIYSGLGRVPAYTEIRDYINKNPQCLFIGPSYIEAELTGRCDLDCIFCYRKTLKKAHGDMEPEAYKKILSDMADFGLPYSIAFSGSGEPMSHGKFYEILDMSLAESRLTNLVIETNGIYADGNFKSYVTGAGDHRIRIIVNINGVDGETYRSVHGADYFDSVTKNIIALKESLAGKDELHVQIMKINETEAFLDRYYDFWEKNGIPVILQKQNTYLGRVEDRRYSDLSPLDRGPCWHLQRDLYVLWDGTVTFCKQDVDGDIPRGNLMKTSLREIWNGSQHSFIQDYRGQFPQRPDCKSCDEWYTFNL